MSSQNIMVPKKLETFLKKREKITLLLPCQVKVANVLGAMMDDGHFWVRFVDKPQKYAHVCL